MKLDMYRKKGVMFKPAAFRRLCVETRNPAFVRLGYAYQPPSGGCVLKLSPDIQSYKDIDPAAFRRLCVET